jgi:hypothetical protein
LINRPERTLTISLKIVALKVVFIADGRMGMHEWSE